METAVAERRKKEPRLPIGSPLHTAYEYALLVAGTFIVAASFNLFLAPNQIASGGTAGISILMEELAGVEPAFTQWGLNIPLFVLGTWLVGSRFGLKTAAGTLLMPLFVLLTSHWEPLTSIPMLAAVFGGLGAGLGLGLVFRGRGSVGGLSVAAQILAKYTGLRIGIAMAVTDGLVILAAGWVFTAEQSMVALIALFLMMKTIDIVQTGFSASKVAYIICDEVEQVAHAVLHDLDRGLTKLTGYGGYTGAERTVLMVVVSQSEVMKLKALVQAADPNAFVIITGAAEVLGQGFKVQKE
jgi:uncharacterized membrane-anchored protein YitT (DUF2179 family)